MNEVQQYNNQLLRQSKVVIAAKDINPEFWRPIFQTKYFRKMRIASIPISVAIASIFDTPSVQKILLRTIGITAGSILSNPVIAAYVREAHSKIDFSRPIFLPHHEKKYPEGWISAARIKETHPIFYIDMRGNMIFLKPSRAEYYRYLFQKSALGKLGYNTWWLRGYLEPPKAPESVKKWANEKLARLMERMKPQLGRAPKPAMVRVESRGRYSKLRRRRLR